MAESETRTKERQLAQNALSELETITMEEAQRRKDEMREQRAQTEGNVAQRLEAQREASERALYDHLSGGQRLIEKCKEFFGYGPEYRYARKLVEVERLAAQLKTISSNGRDILHTYTKRHSELEHQLVLDKMEFSVNSTLATHHERQATDLLAKLETAETQSVYGAIASSDVMALHAELAKSREATLELNTENNMLAVRITTSLEEQNNTKALLDRVQVQMAEYERQRILFEGHLQLATVQRDLVKGLGKTAAARATYEQAAVLVEQLREMQQGLRIPTIEDLPKEFRIPRPGTTRKAIAGKEYWMEVAPQILGYDPSKPKGQH